MRISLFYHSFLSCWNNGHAHFLRGLAVELKSRGHEVQVFEPARGWSRAHLLSDVGEAGLAAFRNKYPDLDSTLYSLDDLDLDEALDGADVVIVHEWNDPELVTRLAACKARRPSDFLLFFHDTHHRAVTAPEEMARFDLRTFDAALVYGEVLREVYRKRGWIREVRTWHEAADTRVFRPMKPESQASRERRGDLVWIGNWGDDERSAELHEYLIEPAKALGMKASVYGVRYPPPALEALLHAGIDYRGWLANALAPEAMAMHRMTVHIPRCPYVKALPGIPTIRVFEALACGIPLICSPWHDVEHLFTPGADYLTVRNGTEMMRALERLMNEPEEAQQLAQHGLETILRRHTIAHRVDQLLEICRALGTPAPSQAPVATAHTNGFQPSRNGTRSKAPEFNQEFGRLNELAPRSE